MEVHVVHQMCVTVSQDMWVTAVRQVSFNAFNQLYCCALKPTFVFL